MASLRLVYIGKMDIPGYEGDALMTKLPIHDVGFTLGARLGDSVPFNKALMSVKDRDGSIAALHALKGLASVLQGSALYGVVWINGTGYATR